MAATAAGFSGIATAGASARTAAVRVAKAVPAAVIHALRPARVGATKQRPRIAVTATSRLPTVASAANGIKLDTTAKQESKLISQCLHQSTATGAATMIANRAIV
jgi:hypothetical protein